MKQKRLDTKMLCMIGLMAALVFVGTNFRIKIPIGSDSTMLHLGNVFCLLGGLLFGGVPGGLAAGIGSALFDLTSEYAREAPITFINKFAMGFTAGMIMHYGAKVAATLRPIRTVISAACGSFAYIVLYMLKTIVDQRFIMGLPWVGVWPIVGVKLATSVTNGIVAVIASVILVLALRPALTKARVLAPSTK